MNLVKHFLLSVLFKTLKGDNQKDLSPVAEMLLHNCTDIFSLISSCVTEHQTSEMQKLIKVGFMKQVAAYISSIGNQAD